MHGTDKPGVYFYFLKLHTADVLSSPFVLLVVEMADGIYRLRFKGLCLKVTKVMKPTRDAAFLHVTPRTSRRKPSKNLTSDLAASIRHHHHHHLCLFLSVSLKHTVRSNAAFPRHSPSVRAPRRAPIPGSTRRTLLSLPRTDEGNRVGPSSSSRFLQRASLRDCRNLEDLRRVCSLGKKRL